jgi:hypothetical protein
MPHLPTTPNWRLLIIDISSPSTKALGFYLLKSMFMLRYVVVHFDGKVYV